MPRAPLAVRELLLAVAAGLFGLVAVVWLSRLASERGLRSELDGDARTAAAAVTTLLDQAEGALERIGQGWSGGCDGATAARLRDGALLGLGAREALLLDPGQSVACTPRGERPLRESPGLPSKEGPVLSPGPSAEVLLLRRLPGGWGRLSVGLGEVERSLGFLKASPGLEVRLVADDGSSRHLAGSGSAPGEAPAQLLRRPLARHPLAIEASASPRASWFRWRRTWPLAAAVGVPFGVFLGALVFLARRGGLSPERQLALALRREELDARYLPIVEARTGRCVGAEVLLRWVHPRLGLLKPDVFVPLAEETGLILPMTEWLLRRVATDLPEGLPDPDGFHVSINLAAAHLEELGTVASIRRAFEGSSLTPRQLVFEVTERELLHAGSGVAEKVIEGLEEWGATLALDDFGTGFSNLATLQRFRLQYLKLDRSLIEGVGRGGLADTVLDAIVDLASRLEMALVAEGVETPEQLEALLSRGVHLCQGYYFSRPLRREELVAFVRKSAEEAERAAEPVDEGPPAAAEALPPAGG